MSDSTAIETTWRAFERQPDAATFEAFHTASHTLAARIAWRALGDVDWMEDAMQALFARLWQDRTTRRIPDGLSPRDALIRWTLNECRTLNRRRARETMREMPLENASQRATGQPDPAEAADHRIVAEAVRRILATLPDPYREALITCEIEGATHAEAGGILGIPARTVQTHVRRGRELLARKLRKAGITLPAGAALALYAADVPATLAMISTSDIIANSSSTVAAAGAIAPAEAAATGGGLLSFPALAAAAACVAVAAVLVWALAAPPSEPAAMNAAATLESTNTVAMVMPDAAEEAETRTETDVARTGTDTTRTSTERVMESSGAMDAAIVDVVDAQLIEEVTSDPVAPSTEDQPRTGRVISAATGEGLAGIEVSLGSKGEDGIPVSEMSAIPLESTVLTDEQGYFYMPNLLADHYSEQELAAVHARGDGLASRTVLIIPQMYFLEEPPLIEIPMPPGGSISGTLYGPSGAPVADATIGFPFMGDIDIANAMAKGYFITYGGIAKTNSRGEFTLDGLPAGEIIDIPVIAKDLPPRIEDDILVGTTDRSIFIEEAGQTLRGVVTRDGSTVEGVRVGANPLVEMSAESQNIFRTMIYSRTTRTDAEGRFEIRGMAPGEYRGAAMNLPNDFVSFEVVVRAGQDATADIEMPAAQPDLTVTFLATDHATDQPISGVGVSTQSFVTEIPGRKPVMREPSNVATTDQDGLAKLTLQSSSQSTQFYVLPPAGWVHFNPKTGGRLQWNPLSMPAPGATEPQILHLTRGEIFRSRILDVDSETPDTEAWIHLGGSDYPIDVDADGRFEIAFTPNDMRQLVVYGRRGGLVVDARATSETDFVLQPYAMLSGRLEDTDGSPVSLMSLSIAHVFEPNRALGSPISFAVTSADGRFLMRDVVPGRIRITTNTTADAPSRIANLKHDLELAPGETRRDVLIKPESGRTFEGVVTDENAEPLAGVSVYLQPRREPGDTSHIESYRGRTDADGYWRVTDVPERPIESVQFSRERYNSSYKRAEEGQSVESPVNAMLSLQNEVRLRLIDAETGQPVARYTVDIFEPRTYRHPGSTSPKHMVSDADGLSPATRAKEGDLAVRIVELDEADEPTGRSTLSLFKVGSGGETEVLELRIGGGTFPVTGGVGLIPGWHPVEGARVTVGDFRPFYSMEDQPSPISDSVGREAFTDAEGNFTIHLAPGSWQLVAAKEGYWCVGPQTVTVTDGPAALEHRIGVQVKPEQARN